MCIKCGKEYPRIEITLQDKNGERTFCPNCLAISYFNDELKLENDEQLICDITNKKGAIIFESYDEHYILEKDIMLRLIAHNLKPEEYFVLCKKYSENNYMLHDDFYTEEGIAIQPMDLM